MNHTSQIVHQDYNDEINNKECTQFLHKQTVFKCKLVYCGRWLTEGSLFSFATIRR